jgi:DNA polymerase phi
MSQVILPIFTRLWNGDANTRIEASAQLVGHLESSQKSAATEAAATTDNEADGSQLEDGLAADVSYSLKRLIRGLASPRESSRIGFAVALTEVRPFPAFM